MLDVVVVRLNSSNFVYYLSPNSLELKVSNDAVQLNNAYSVESIFGKIIGLKEYRVKVTLKAQEINGDIVIEKE